MENVQIMIFKRESIKVPPYETMYGIERDTRLETNQEYQERVNRFLEDHTVYSIKPLVHGVLDEGTGNLKYDIMVIYKSVEATNPFSDCKEYEIKNN